MGIGIGLLEGFGWGGDFIWGVEVEGGKSVGSVVNEVDLLFVVGGGEIEVGVEWVIEVGFGGVWDDVVVGEGREMVGNGEG